MAVITSSPASGSPRSLDSLVNAWGDPVFSYRNAGDRPDYPGFNQITMANNRLPGDLEISGDINGEALNSYKNRAMTAGPSAWAKMMQQKNQGQVQANLGDASAQAASGAASARSNLAMRGGLRGGAAERIAKDANRARMSTSQDIRRQGDTTNFDILTKDDQQKQDMLGKTVGFENDRTNIANDADKFNITNAIGQKRDQDMATINEYNEKMHAWAANQQANATANSGKK